MSGYANVDGVIAAWINATGSALFTEQACAPARYFHMPGDQPFECFQVSVSLPDDGRTIVAAQAIDTNDDSQDQMDQTWEGPVSELDGMLSVAVGTIEKWKARERTKPDPPSPW